MIVHQVLSGAGPFDAITAEAIRLRERFRAWGWGGEDYAYRIAPGLNGQLAPGVRLRPPADDLLLIHHSAAWPRVWDLLELPGRKLLRYHNVTPAELLWEYAPVQAMLCAAGREQLAELVPAASATMAVSRFNAAELAALGAERPDVVPLLLERSGLGPPRASPPPGPPVVLFVGRLAPHKRQDDVIRAFALYRRHRAPDARLVLVGEPITIAYVDRLQRLADSLVPGAVSIESGLTEAELGDRYRAAHVFLCLSEHEGFCAPLLEAFRFGVPVVARPAGAVPETAGDAALLVEDRDLAVVAELLHLAVSDPELRGEVRARGHARLAAYDPDVVAEQMRIAIQSVAS